MTFWYNLIEYYTTNGGFDKFVYYLTVLVFYFCFHFNEGMQISTFFIESYNNFFRRIEYKTFTFDGIGLNGFASFGNVIQTKHHVL